jgi:hypothetical protein
VAVPVLGECAVRAVTLRILNGLKLDAAPLDNSEVFVPYRNLEIFSMGYGRMQPLEITRRDCRIGLSNRYFDIRLAAVAVPLTWDRFRRGNLAMASMGFSFWMQTRVNSEACPKTSGMLNIPYHQIDMSILLTLNEWIYSVIRVWHDPSVCRWLP